MCFHLFLQYLFSDMVWDFGTSHDVYIYIIYYKFMILINVILE